VEISIMSLKAVPPVPRESVINTATMFMVSAMGEMMVSLAKHPAESNAAALPLPAILL
jgi:hypothetical protein